MERISRRAQAVRHFNRFYTRQIGVLHQSLLNSPYSLTEARVIYELGQKESSTASQLGELLDLDAGYLSRMLSGFQKKGLIHKERSPKDGRQSILSLTESGRKTYNMLNSRSQTEIEAMLDQMSEPDQSRMVSAMQTIQSLLDKQPAEKPAYILRPPQPGDLGWVVSRHGAMYAQEYGWDESFEGLVAGIIAEFSKNYDPEMERCWIAEVNGENAGSVFVVNKGEGIAKLRMLIVDPKARGLGIGKRLVQECLDFAREKGYKRITLWTNSCLLAARHIYRQAGFELVDSEPYLDFGQDLVSETWERDL